MYSLTDNGGSWTSTLLHAFTSGSDGAYGGTLDISSNGTLYGLTYGGGTYGDGAAYELAKSGGVWKETVLHSFGAGGDGSEPYGMHLDGKTGALYGTTEYGGSNNLGTVFEIAENRGTWSESLLHSFGGRPYDGANPLSGVTQSANGTIFGSTSLGGTSNVGVVYNISP